MNKKLFNGFAYTDFAYTSYFEPKNYLEIKEIFKKVGNTFLPRGTGTSYGDASISEKSTIILTKKLNKIIKFEKIKGVLTCESGVTIKKINEEITLHNWFLPVTPGTDKASIGGAIACDAHGKNYSSGTISNFIIYLKIITGEGKILKCSENENAELFYSTIGGMGLTGIILELQINLKKISSEYIFTTTLACNNLKDMLNKLNIYKDSNEYIYTWIDTTKKGSKLGRGIIKIGNHVKIKKNIKIINKTKINFNLIFFRIINLFTTSIFNKLYFYKIFFSKQINSYEHYIDFFYPLERMKNWQKLYGKKGFIEYQCFLPEKDINKSIREILELINKLHLAVYICSIKLLSKSRGEISFSDSGYTLAFDFPNYQNSEKIVNLFDEITLKYKGKINLSKNSILTNNNFIRMFNLDKFLQARDKRFSSSMSERLKI